MLRLVKMKLVCKKHYEVVGFQESVRELTTV
jgi:hypothetical protein